MQLIAAKEHLPLLGILLVKKPCKELRERKISAVPESSLYQAPLSFLCSRFLSCTLANSMHRDYMYVEDLKSKFKYTGQCKLGNCFVN